MEELVIDDYVDWYGDIYKIIDIQGDMYKIEPTDEDLFSFSGERDRWVYESEISIAEEPDNGRVKW